MEGLLFGLTASSLWSTLAVKHLELRVWRLSAKCGFQVTFGARSRFHRFVGYREGVIDFRLFLEKLGQDFDGVGTHEYLGKYHNHLAQDALWANEFCY